jgi:hypothetical protein
VRSNGLGPTGVYPSAYAVSFLGPGALSWLPALWVNADRPRVSRFGGPRHLAMVGLEQGDAGQLAHPSAPVPNLVGTLETDDDDLSEHDDVLRTTAGMAGGPVLVCAWDRQDFEMLGIPRLDIATSAAMATAGAPHVAGGPSDELKQGAWQLLAAGDTRCISQVETPGMQAVLRRVREAAEGSSRRHWRPSRTSRNSWRCGGPAPTARNVQMYKMFKCSKSAPRSREYHSTSWLAPSQRI